MKKILGVDIGYSNVKAAATSAGSKDELKQSISEGAEEGQTRIFSNPAGAMPTSEMPKMLGMHQKKSTSGIEVMYKGEEWTAGLDFSNNPGISRELSASYIYRDEWMVLLYACMIWSGWSEIDTLVLGLPCDEFYNRKDMVAHLEGLQGVHEVKKGKQVTVNKVIVAPQPIGSLMGYSVTDASQALNDSIWGRSTVLLVDPGFYSLDYVGLTNGAIVQQTAGSSRFSMRAVCDHAVQALRKDFPRNFTQSHEIEYLMRTGSTMLLIEGKEIDVTEYIERASEYVVGKAMREIRSDLSSAGFRPDRVLITGGGADIFEKYIRREIETHEFLKSQSLSVLMNAFGYLLLGIDDISDFG